MKTFLPKIFLVLSLLSIHGYAVAQRILVSGRVLDAENSSPMPGVSVSVKGTSTGVITDADGNYAVEVPSETSVLVFSFVSYVPQEVTVGSQQAINISLESDAALLNEVVVAGAVIRQGDLTGAVSRMDNKKIQEIPTTSVVQAMAGRMTGVLVQNSPGVSGGASIKIRGNNSIQFGTNPIFVVDGLIIDGGYNLINPNDIEDITVLKDASSTAIYGSRGSNGVVLITTKKGKRGAGKISYDAWYGVQSFSRDMSRLGARGIFDLRTDAYANAYMDANPAADRQAYIDNFILNQDPGMSLAFSDYEFETINNNRSYNWLDEVTRKGAQQNHSVSFSKGSDEGSFYASFNYTRNRGLMENSTYQRVGGKVNIEQNIKPWLKVGTSTGYTRSHEEYVQGGVFSIANRANPLLPVSDTLTYLKWAGVTSLDDYNPIRSLTIDGDGYQSRLMSSNFINIRPIKNLNIRSTFAVDGMDQKDLWYTPRDLGQSKRNSTEGTAQHRNDHWLNWQWDNTVSYDFTFGEKHDLNAMAGFSAQKNNWDYNQLDAKGFATDDFSYYYVNSFYNRDDTQLYSDFVTTTLASFIGRANYTYDNKYFATVTARYDGSSKFGPGNKWGLFPSIGMGWSLSEEGFFKNLNADFVNLIKLRAGYGIAGNQNIPNYAYYSLYRPNYTSGSVTYVSDGRLGNPDLVWEKQKQLDIGLEATLLDNRISLTANYFNIVNEDLLMVRSLSTITGFYNVIANVGTLENKGVEFNLNATVLNTGGFQWTVSGNISTARNKITKLFGDVDAIYNQGGFTGVEIQREGNLFLGKSINSIYVYKFEKIAQESDMDRLAEIDFGGRIVQPGDIVPVDRNHDGVINDDDRYVVGSRDPKFYGGFSTDLSWKGISLNAVFTYNYGGKRISYLYESMMGGSGMSAAHHDMLDRWTPENTNTSIPRAYSESGRYNVGDVDWGVQDASFLRLSALTLAYNLPSAFLEKAKINSFRIYFTGSNLFVATRYKGYDPEGGDDYPTSRMFVTGINMSF
jgi:TonB-linked SusC/RagA family outer membrane protein